jgi:hypothetical protein
METKHPPKPTGAQCCPVRPSTINMDSREAGLFRRTMSSAFVMDIIGTYLQRREHKKLAPIPTPLRLALDEPCGSAAV